MRHTPSSSAIGWPAALPLMSQKATSSMPSRPSVMGYRVAVEAHQVTPQGLMAERVLAQDRPQVHVVELVGRADPLAVGAVAHRVPVDPLVGGDVRQRESAQTGGTSSGMGLLPYQGCASSASTRVTIPVIFTPTPSEDAQAAGGLLAARRGVPRSCSLRSRPVRAAASLGFRRRFSRIAFVFARPVTMPLATGRSRWVAVRLLGRRPGWRRTPGTARRRSPRCSRPCEVSR